MLAKEIIAQVKRLEIRTRRVVDELMGGAYHSRFKGRGMEFDEVREYIPGDDVRDIDWNVTARLGEPFIKKYVEERELHVMIAVDTSASLLYGSGNKTKMRVASELGALLTLSAIRNHDKVGMLTFTDQIENHIPAQAGRGHALRIIRDLVNAQPQHTRTDLAMTCNHLRKTLKRRSVIFLISDFMEDPTSWEKPLSLLSHKHDVVLIHVIDEQEKGWDLSGCWALEDAETHAMSSWNGSSKNKTAFSHYMDQLYAQIETNCTRSKAGYIPVHCDEELVTPLMRYFGKRRR